MLRGVTLLALLAALAPVGASAANPVADTDDLPPVVEARQPVSTNVAKEATEYVAGRIGDIGCLPETEWRLLVEATGHPLSTTGMTWVNAGRVRYAPWVCAALTQGVSHPLIGQALNTVAHEGTHLGGVRDEPAAACAGLNRAVEIAVRYYGISATSRDATRVQRGASEMHSRLPAPYHTICA